MNGAVVPNVYCVWTCRGCVNCFIRMRTAACGLHNNSHRDHRCSRRGIRTARSWSSFICQSDSAMLIWKFPCCLLLSDNEGPIIANHWVIMLTW